MATLEKRTKWQIWFDVIYALLVREIRIGFNDKFGISWAVLNPVIFILVLSFLRGRLDGGETHTIPTFVFMAYGLINIQIFLQTFSAGASAIQKHKALFAFRQVQPISAILAACFFEILVKIFVIVGLMVAMYFLGIELHAANPLKIMLYIFLIWVFAMSLGILFGLMIAFVPEVKKIQLLITRPLFFISGVFFSLQDFPQSYWHVLNWNPILHAIELSRYSAYPAYGHSGVSESFLFIVVLTTTFIALSCYQIAWKQAISR
ncbi:ABC transporter permease [Neptunicella marina]|uniref:Transport permease protein n=1 Tax=Neptunicella marina TaxID=2125989 RepID=A0A8J6IQ24_9ALTE|nr:ABC transporter permease [Neptunicella marina]MBC3764956.1 ABC transporter permease [Neptunicella marina]